MTLGYIGLGKMGYPMVLNLLEHGHTVVAYNRSREPLDQVKAAGAVSTYSYDEFFKRLPSPRTIWIMVPHEAVEAVLTELVPRLSSGDTVIDGGNSPYRQSQERYARFMVQGISFLDVGISGGVYGARHGTCIMVGGDRAAYERCEALFESLSANGGYGYMGASGAGHFVKMIHNAIEYGMMEAIAEGFDVLNTAPFPLNLPHIAELYNHNSVISSRLMGWLADAYKKHGADLSAISGTVAATGEGEWTIQYAKEKGVPVPSMELALAVRRESEQNPRYAGKILSALRNEFGGHEVLQKKV